MYEGIQYVYNYNYYQTDMQFMPQSGFSTSLLLPFVFFPQVKYTHIYTLSHLTEAGLPRCQSAQTQMKRKTSEWCSNEDNSLAGSSSAIYSVYLFSTKHV